MILRESAKQSAENALINAITARLMFLNVLLLTKSPQKPEMLICFSFAN